VDELWVPPSVDLLYVGPARLLRLRHVSHVGYSGRKIGLIGAISSNDVAFRPIRWKYVAAELLPRRQTVALYLKNQSTGQGDYSSVAVCSELSS
jgi:hypothetical protein